MEIKFKSKDHPEVKSVTYGMPESLNDLVAKFGEQVVADAAVNNFTIALQAILRRNIAETSEFLQNLADQWEPNQRTPGTKKSAIDKATTAISKLTPEERAALLEQLRAG